MSEAKAVDREFQLGWVCPGVSKGGASLSLCTPTFFAHQPSSFPLATGCGYGFFSLHCDMLMLSGKRNLRKETFEGLEPIPARRRGGGSTRQGVTFYLHAGS